MRAFRRCPLADDLPVGHTLKVAIDADVCRFCSSEMRSTDDRDLSGAFHVACVEASEDDNESSRAAAQAPLQRFFRNWWGAGHH